MMPARGPIDEQTVRSARGALGAHVPGRAGGGVRALPGPLPPYGLCEPHGPQSALGCDGLRAHAICRRAATAHGGVVAPPHYWHIHEIGGFGIWASRKVGEVARPWLTAVPPWLFFKTLCYHVRAADQLGFHAAVLYSGHGGPHATDAARFLELIQPRVGARWRSWSRATT